MKKNLYIDHYQINYHQKKNFKVILDEHLIKNYNTNLLKKKSDKNSINYFWNKRQTKQKDVLKIDVIKKEIFNYLVKKLEHIHGERNGQQYWEIILMPWLDSIIPKIFYLWKITYNINQNYIAHLYDYNSNEFITNSFEDIKYYENLDFNRWILSKIIIHQNKIEFKKKKIKVKYNFRNNLQKDKLFTYILKCFYNFLSNFFNSRIMIDNIQVGKWNLILLNLKLKQFPFLWIREKFQEEQTDKKKRIFLSSKKNKKKDLINFIKNNLVFFLPKNYLENYKNIKESIKKSYWPKKTKIILTSTSYWFDDFFKIWAANQKLNRSKYFIMQHGGRMGFEKIHTNEAVQIKISDRYLTWGWKSKNKKIIPFHSLLLSRIKDGYKFLNAKKIVFCQNVYPTYFNHIDGGPILFEDKIYSTLLCNQVFEKLNKNLRDTFIMRYLKDSNYKYRPYHSYLVNSKIKKDVGKKKLQNIFKYTRIFIHDQDSTSFLETLSANIPTFLVLKKSYLDSKRPSIKNYYLDLEKTNIIFTNSSKLSDFINLNYSSIDKWWHNSKTQKAKNNFCNKLAKKSNNSLRELSNLLIKNCVH